MVLLELYGNLGEVYRRDRGYVERKEMQCLCNHEIFCRWCRVFMHAGNDRKGGTPQLTRIVGYTPLYNACRQMARFFLDCEDDLSL